MTTNPVCFIQREMYEGHKLKLLPGSEISKNGLFFILRMTENDLIYLLFYMGYGTWSKFTSFNAQGLRSVKLY